MFQTGKKINLGAFSLVEIIVALAIFSFLVTAVITITFKMVSTQKKIQAQLFLAQTAQTTIEAISRQVRYGYNYAGNTQAGYDSSEAAQTVYAFTSDVSNTTGSAASSSQNLVNAENSPFILFESQGGNPNTWTDQNAFCAYAGKLYKISLFAVETDGITYKARCDTGDSMLPDSITLDKISFDIYGGDSQNPKNPMVRIKIRISHEDGGSMDMQTTVTQRLVTYF